MDIYMSKNIKPSTQKLMELETSFTQAIQFAQEIWGDKAFSRPDGNNQLVQGFYDIQMVPLTFFNTTQLKHLGANKSKFKSLFQKKYDLDTDFNESIRQFTSNPSNVRYRMQTMRSLISLAIK